MINDQFDELRLTGNLPSPSGVGIRILQLTKAEDYSLSDLIDLVKVDPALTGRIIKIANSVEFATVEPVTSVATAAVRLGVKRIRTVALGFSLIAGNRTGQCSNFDYEHYWSWSLAGGVAAQALARELGRWDAIEAFTCGLLSSIGKMALATVHPDNYSKVIEVTRDTDLDGVLEEEDRVFHINHLQISAAMMGDWGLPEEFAGAVLALQSRCSDLDLEPEPTAKLSAILRAGTLLADHCVEHEAFGTDAWDPEGAEVKQIAEELEITESELRKISKLIRTEWPQWGDTLQIPTKSRRSSEPEAPLTTLAPPSVSKPLPRTPEPLTAEEGDFEGGADARPKATVLAVDDDPKQLRLLVHHLSKEGYDVITASDGDEALQVSLEHNPQIVVTDWMMPEMSGLELCKALRTTKAGRSMYVLLLTAREDEDRIVEAFNAGADDYVAKPFNPRILLARVRAGQRLIELQDQVDFDKQNRMRQVAEMGRLTRKLRAAALTDVLTELPNRRYAMKRLEEEWDNARRANRPLSVIMVDIDFFKSVNDQYGHDVGDEVLRDTAKVLRAKTRRSDVVCRLGGEEFLVININSSAETANVCAERLRASVEANSIQTGEYDSGVTVSLGLAQLNESMRDVDSLLKAADEAVYRAKEAGRNRVEKTDSDSSQARPA